MSLILNIETATKTCSVNLAKKGDLLDKREITSEKYIHDEKLHLLIKELFESTKINLKNLEAVGVSSGPGSFTGLRIGVSAAKGIAFALKIPLISMNAIDIMIQNYQMPSGNNNNAIFLPMIDARREEVYTAGYDCHKKRLDKISCPEINELFFNNYKSFKEVYFLGNGATKFKNKWNDRNVFFDDLALNSSLGMISGTYEKFIKKDFEDLSYFNPFYLKDFKTN